MFDYDIRGKSTRFFYIQEQGTPYASLLFRSFEKTDDPDLLEGDGSTF